MISEPDIEFLQTVWSRRPFFTYTFFGINIVIFLLMTFAGGTTNEPILRAFGAKTNVLIDQGEYWRFVTPVFIHIGLLHLVFNSYALWVVGPQVEKLYGGARFVVLYLLTGVAGVLGSYLYRPGGLSAGASGAIFGLFGVLFVFGIRYRHNVPPFFRRAVGMGVLPIILINLVIGFSIPMIDNSAHIGGLIAGMALAAVIPYERHGTQTPWLFSAAQVLLFLVVLVSFAEIYLHYDGPRLAFQNLYSGNASSGADVPDVINHVQGAFGDSLKALDASSGGHSAAVKTSIADVAKAIDELKSMKSLGAKGDALAGDMVSLLQDQYALLQDVDRSNTMTLAHDRRATENAQKYRELMDSFFSWVQTDGSRYGIQLRHPR